MSINAGDPDRMSARLLEGATSGDASDQDVAAGKLQETPSVLDSRDLSVGAVANARRVRFFVVRPLGLEPRTSGLKVRCSNQLS